MKFPRFLLALLTALPLAATPALAADKLSLILDWYVNPDHGPIIIAREKGFFREEGLDVDIIAPADPSAPPKMVAAGQADIAVSYQQQIHLQAHEGLPLLRVGTLIGSPLNCLLTLADGPVKSITDLKGKKVGFSVAGVEESILQTILAKNGLKMSDVELINVNWSLAPSLMSKQVDAVIGAYRNVELNQMAVEGVKGRCFYVEEEGVPPYDELIYVANAKTMDKDKISRFLAATEKATQFILNHPQESYEIYASTGKELQDEANKRAWFDTLPRFALRPAALDIGRYRRYEAFLKEHGLVPSILPVSKIAIDVNAEGPAQ
ncbi:putative hydroxymethylpyrimidine transport system substrate-binding protein [Mesorhizobium sp. RMAD-H1]|nr:putative hydroxymethylpyrimidine transport system substrate-binding protein [Mesorhizobium sp. RMAD-H1]